MFEMIFIVVLFVLCLGYVVYRKVRGFRASMSDSGGCGCGCEKKCDGCPFYSETGFGSGPSSQS